MKYYFEYKNKSITKKASKELRKEGIFLKRLSEALNGNSFSSVKEYSNIIRRLISISKKYNLKSPGSLIYPKEIGPITKNLALTEKTQWGGVSLKKVDVENNYIRKLLVVRKLGVLGFEYHKIKHERLKVLEGFCLVLYSNHRSEGWKNGKINWKIATIGDKFRFLPYDEHGIIALTNSVIEERSTNNLDDLFFIYKL